MITRLCKVKFMPRYLNLIQDPSATQQRSGAGYIAYAHVLMSVYDSACIVHPRHGAPEKWRLRYRGWPGVHAPFQYFESDGSLLLCGMWLISPGASCVPLVRQGIRPPYNSRHVQIRRLPKRISPFLSASQI